MTDHERYADDRTREPKMRGPGLSMLLVGLGFGALLGIFLAPTTGKKARRLFRRRFEDAREMVNDRTADLKERAKDWRSKGEDFAGEASGRIKQLSRKRR